MLQGLEQSETVTVPSPALTQTSVDPNRAEDITAIGGLSTSILHDLRNPASAICAATEILVHMERLPTGVKRLATNIHGSAGRVQELLTADGSKFRKLSTAESTPCRIRRRRESEG